ncbi:hypothetical protein HDU79_005705 [Rhizoclosmatium sp. JEL0117]|nr:hypothetical protein HDU79_005705 [Rhizoclosmatium sp. JEL0117]
MDSAITPENVTIPAKGELVLLLGDVSSPDTLSFLPKWQSLVETYADRGYNTIPSLSLSSIDCSPLPDFCRSAFNVVSYPTINLYRDGKLVSTLRENVFADVLLDLGKARYNAWKNITETPPTPPTSLQSYTKECWHYMGDDGFPTVVLFYRGLYIQELKDHSKLDEFVRGAGEVIKSVEGGWRVEKYQGQEFLEEGSVKIGGRWKFEKIDRRGSSSTREIEVSEMPQAMMMMYAPAVTWGSTQVLSQPAMKDLSTQLGISMDQVGWIAQDMSMLTGSTSMDWMGGVQHICITRMVKPVHVIMVARTCLTVILKVIKIQKLPPPPMVHVLIQISNVFVSMRPPPVKKVQVIVQVIHPPLKVVKIIIQKVIEQRITILQQTLNIPLTSCTWMLSSSLNNMPWWSIPSSYSSSYTSRDNTAMDPNALETQNCTLSVMEQIAQNAEKLAGMSSMDVTQWVQPVADQMGVSPIVVSNIAATMAAGMMSVSGMDVKGVGMVDGMVGVGMVQLGMALDGGVMSVKPGNMTDTVPENASIMTESASNSVVGLGVVTTNWSDVATLMGVITATVSGIDAAAILGTDNMVRTMTPVPIAPISAVADNNRERHAGILKFGESWAFQYCFSVQKITPRIVRMTISRKFLCSVRLVAVLLMIQSAVALNINPTEGARLTPFIQDESSDRIQQGTTNQGEPVSTTTIICITIAFAFILLLGGLCYWFLIARKKRVQKVRASMVSIASTGRTSRDKIFFPNEDCPWVHNMIVPFELEKSPGTQTIAYCVPAPVEYIHRQIEYPARESLPRLDFDEDSEFGDSAIVGMDQRLAELLKQL